MGGTKISIDVWLIAGFSNRHIIKFVCVLLRILSVFSPTIFSIKLEALGHPNKIHSTKIFSEARLIPLAILISTVAINSTDVSELEAYFAVLSKFSRALNKFFSAS